MRRQSIRVVDVCVCLLALGVFGSSARAQTGATDGEWRSYGGDLGSTKYSPLDQIDETNFADLRIAWRWQSVDRTIDLAPLRQRYAETGLGTRYAIGIQFLNATPLMVGGVLYLSTPLYQAAAIDAGTGETLWAHDPESFLAGLPPHRFNSRGVAYWTDGAEARVLWGTGDGYLVAVDARTGRPSRDFGDNGRVDLREGIPRAGRETTDHRGRQWLGLTSPPIVAHDVVVTPTIISDYPITKEAPPGWIKGVDVRTGATKWTFRTVPQADDFGVETWLNDSWKYSGNTNVWSMLSVDDELGYVYLPTGTPSNDYYGGHRLGDNLFAESLVALDIETGQRMWHFQMVHHGLWDYDNPAAPNLVDITVDGRRIKAVAQVTKQGFTYVFDRATGDPVWPIDERPVPPATMPGDVASPTQPFPTKPPPFEYLGVTIDDLVDFTPEIRAMAVEAVKNFRLGPIYTPPTLAVEGGLQGTIQRPSAGGGANWSGAAVDPETGLLYVPSTNAISVLNYFTPDPAQGGNLQYTWTAARPPGQGSPGGQQPRMPQGLPLLKPPYTRTTAIDLNSGEHAWMVPNGDGNRLRNHPLLAELDLPPLGGDGRGGPLVTKTLLISALTAGGTDDGPRLVARDKATGEEIASVDLPSGALGTPMTYLHDGTQYIALTVGGDIPELIALAVP
ncbi:MAG: pyrroloquinoline quinone-dependent dehydrogenase [Acidobacteria bacterium]|nr:pyrroloquinoline quinone-dependent dehydrogenase [Acidobacteriota bacterium]